jgi:hypothetical protein
MQTQKQPQPVSLNELRDEHKQLVIEKERLEEQIWNSKAKPKK